MAPMFARSTSVSPTPTTGAIVSPTRRATKTISGAPATISMVAGGASATPTKDTSIDFGLASEEFLSDLRDVLRVSALPIILGLSAMVMIALLAPRLRPDESVEKFDAKRARWCVTLCRFLAKVSFTVAIVDSLDFISAQGGSMAMFCVFVGLEKCTHLIGLMLTQCVCQHVPTAWQRAFSITMVSYTLSLFGALLNTFLNIRVPNKSTPHTAPQLNFQLLLVLSARGIQGVGFCAMEFVTKHIITALSLPDERAAHLTNLNTATMIGLGAGPCLSMLAHFIDDQMQSSRHKGNSAFGVLLTVNLTQVVLCSVMMFSVWFTMPRTLPPSTKGKKNSTETSPDSAVFLNRLVLMMCTCLSFSGCRGCIVSSAEVAAATVVETTLKWVPKLIAMSLSCIFRSFLPALSVFRR